MTPQREPHATLVDLLDRVLDKGLVIQADLIVSVAGIPLIGVNLRAALAGMETMLKYGIMQEWDENIRIWEAENRSRQKHRLTGDETLILEILGAFHNNKGLSASWQYGRIVVTNTRLILYHELFDRILFEIPIPSIKGIGAKQIEKSSVDESPQELQLLLRENQWCRIKARDLKQLKGELKTAVKNSGGRVWDVSKARTETCPQCGRLDFVKTLLEEGCPDCGWTRPGKSPAVETVSTV